jgi:glycosyltransferase involved in cell wall biosynthesis
MVQGGHARVKPMPIAKVVHLSKMTGTAGSEGHLRVLLAGLKVRGLDVHLWVLSEPNNPVQDYVDQITALGIPVERIPIRADIDPGLWFRLAKGLRQTHPDLLHTHLLHADLYGIPAARRAEVPLIVSSRHNDDRFRRRWLFRALHRWLWQQANAGIAISEAIRQFSIEVEHAPADRIHTIHYGLDPDTVRAPVDARAALRADLGLPPETPLVGSVCRLIEQKGLTYGLRGFAQVAAQYPEAHYVIAGEGSLRTQLEDQARQLGVADRVHFLGWRDNPYAVFAALDVLLAPSLWEGFGLVFLEAMALGVPVISTTVSAIPEVVVDGQSGWLVPASDADALAAALREALAHPKMRQQRGINGRRRLETNFSVETMVERTLAVYRGLEARS